MGPYCKYCGRRCFVPRIVPGRPGTIDMATCADGMAHDLKATGFTHQTARNPAVPREVRRIMSQDDLVALANVLCMREDWHEPDERQVDATVTGVSFGNDGAWGTAEQRQRAFDRERGHGDFPVLEMWVTLSQAGEPVAEVNLATLFAWACGYRDE